MFTHMYTYISLSECLGRGLPMNPFGSSQEKGCWEVSRVPAPWDRKCWERSGNSEGHVVGPLGYEMKLVWLASGFLRVSS